MKRFEKLDAFHVAGVRIFALPNHLAFILPDGSRTDCVLCALRSRRRAKLFTQSLLRSNEERKLTNRKRVH